MPVYTGTHRKVSLLSPGEPSDWRPRGRETETENKVWADRKPSCLLGKRRGVLGLPPKSQRGVQKAPIPPSYCPLPAGLCGSSFGTVLRHLKLDPTHPDATNSQGPRCTTEAGLRFSADRSPCDNRQVTRSHGLRRFLTHERRPMLEPRRPPADTSGCLISPRHQ